MFVGAETDRITYRRYTVILKAPDALLVCYIFKDHLYLAILKLEQFIERVLTDAARCRALTEVQQKSRVLGLSALQALIAEVFQS